MARRTSKTQNIRRRTSQRMAEDTLSPPWTPVWEKWRCTPVVEMEEAVALSCNIDPSAILCPEEWGANVDEFESEFRSFAERLDIAMRNARHLHAERGHDRRGTKGYFVDLVTFVSWAKKMSARSSVWKSLPEEFLQLGDSPDEEVHTRTRNTYLSIIHALAKNQYDLADPYKAGESIALLTVGTAKPLKARAVGDVLKEAAARAQPSSSKQSAP